MGSHIDFWRKCFAKARSGGLSDFANDWQWTVAVPLATSAGIGVTMLSTGYAALDGLIAALVAFALTWLLALFVKTLRAAPQIYYEEHSRAEALQNRISDLMNSYSYRLQLESINAEDIRERSKEDGSIKHRHIRYAMKFKSFSDQPIRYIMDQQSINQEVRQATQNSGIIPPNGTATFYSFPISGDKENLTALIRSSINIIVRYGHPEKATRLMRKEMVVDTFPASGNTNFLYVSDTEEAIKDGDQETCRAAST